MAAINDNLQTAVPETQAFRGRDIRVPHSIFLRTACHPAVSGKGTIRVEVQGGSTVLIRSPSTLYDGSLGPHGGDEVLSGTIEITMKERRRVQAISVVIQSVSRLYMGGSRGWEEDGLFERGVEIIGEDAYGEALWLDQGTTSYSFSLLLPVSLAASDRHIFGRLSYLLTARIEGIDPTPSRFGLPLATHITTPVIGDDIRFKQDFERVIEHSNKAERALGRFRTGDGKRPGGLPTEAQRRASELSMARTCEADPRLDGLFQQQVIRNDGSSDARETPKWLKGDIVISQNISIQSSGLQNESRTSLDMTNQAYEEGLGVYQVSMSSDCFAVGGAVIVRLSCLSPSPRTVIMSIEAYIVQQYYVFSPRHPRDPPRTDEQPTMTRLLQEGAKDYTGSGPSPSTTPSLYVGSALPSPTAVSAGTDWTWHKTARMPDHRALSPTTPKGMVTPIRVVHNLVVIIDYGEVDDQGQLIRRTAESRIELQVPGCMAHTRSLALPTFGRERLGTVWTLDGYEYNL
ncbi:uncharacterized protein MKK02DRAFT_42389 [Dioszegia hungarica]|uniref:Arrestin-like N-terminal domain-containing protein n=1 Tax=Dioszegia hungarica TaxID=4972 RepID=A0AA38HFG2_9TREE|nr:uncharacterized protein MKK02DRAFT_42389 [Dioszegia hungarica]KAI9638006.1 hypothetical protein MKK02DRAFT_42389 [Dioszegia hungarica]